MKKNMSNADSSGKKMFTYFGGIDVSKDSFDIAVINKEMQIIIQEKFDMNSEGFNQLMDLLTKSLSDRTLFVMEATGIYHLNLYSFLMEQGCKTAIVNPLLIHNFSKTVSLRKTKTDKKDAEKIAQFALMYQQNIDTSGKKKNIARAIVRERDHLSQNVARLKTEIKNLLQVLFPELEHNTNVFTKTMLKLLLKAPGRFPIMKMRPQVIGRIFKTTRGNRIRIAPSTLINLAKKSIGVQNDMLEVVLKSKIERLIFILNQINNMNDNLKQYIEKNIQQDFAILTSVNGIGKTTAEKFLVEIGDISNFSSHNQLRAYIGTDPSIKHSGSSINNNGKISKRGNAYLRKTIWQMAVGVIRCCEQFKKYFQKKMDEGKKYKQAVIAVANKLIKTLYAMLKNKIYFKLTKQAN
ncbi:MAG: IS110 family transposase [Candidatus Cloacimonetes bacterium]|nr:IS110 family transposase [Candidatus Cloacimonadota bacterium]MBL7086889.1 IS110 family transposase [Candidatus Cloacimonadota bacterium]